ncbi:Counting factor 60 [Smittium culicis]|uniref:Counting factor 60 n=1 Tax=Smittium culicis TaxID=133412 RepID=A0A1R1XHG6_9FUNG|nr:Counting factor 60 [Smittium culicis]
MKSVLIVSTLSIIGYANGVSTGGSNRSPVNSVFSDSFNKIYNSLNDYSGVYDYCQANFIDASTYTPLKNSELISVQMVARHGDRAPFFFIENEGDLYNFCNLSKYNSILRPMTSTMVNSTTDRLVEGSLAEMPTTDKCIAGGLTEKGGLMSLDLGKAIRSVYVDKLGFLNPTLRNPNQLKVRINSLERSLQSANFFLSGLYPVTGNDTDVIINSFYLPAEKEDMFDNFSACPKAQYFSDVIQASDEYKEYLSQNPEYISFMNTLFSTDTKDPVFVRTRAVYLDLLQTRVCHNLPKPCKTKGECATDDMYKAFRAGMNWEYIFQKTMSQHSPEYNIVLQGFFVSDFKRDLEEAVRNSKGRRNHRKRSPKFYLYSARDSAINDIVFTLLGDTPETFLPPHSSNLLVEAWKNKSSGKLSVRVIYNNKVLRVLGEDGSSEPWCDMNSCDYSTFIDFLSKRQITDPATQCAI